MSIYDFSHDYQLVFGTDVSIPMTKAQRMLYGESAMTHAMVLTGVNVDVSDRMNCMNKIYNAMIILHLFRMVMQQNGVLKTLGVKNVATRVT
jgi:hypothetical protein